MSQPSPGPLPAPRHPKRRKGLALAVGLLALILVTTTLIYLVLPDTGGGENTPACAGHRFLLSTRNETGWVFTIGIAGGRCPPVSAERVRYRLIDSPGIVLDGNVSELDGSNGIRFESTHGAPGWIELGDRFEILETVADAGNDFFLLIPYDYSTVDHQVITILPP